MAQEIDEEIFRLIGEAHRRAGQVLVEHERELHEIGGILIEQETIDKEQFERLLEGEPEQDVFSEGGPPPAISPKAPRKRAVAKPRQRKPAPVKPRPSTG